MRASVVSSACLSFCPWKRIRGVDKEVKQSLDVKINAVQHRGLDAREKTFLSPILLCVLQGGMCVPLLRRYCKKV